MKKLFALLLLAQLLAAEVILNVSKTPYEAFTCSMDFIQVVGTDTMVLTSVTSINTRTGANTTSTIISSSPAPAIIPMTDKIGFRIQNGQVGEIHQVSVKVTDSTTGSQYEGNMLLTITAN